MLISNFRATVLEIVQVACGCSVLHFSRFLQAFLGYRPSSLHAPDSDASCDILNLADARGLSILACKVLSM